VPLAAAQAPTAWAGGTVVDEAGRPVAGARVELLRLEVITLVFGRRGQENPTVVDKLVVDGELWATSGADGRFRFDGLPSHSRFLLRITQSGFTVLTRRDLESAAAGGQIALGTLQLPKVPTLAGRVVDSAGRPVAGAQVWALSAGDVELMGGSEPLLDLADRKEGPVALTGRDGRFAIPRFEPGILGVCSPGLVPAQVTPLPSRPNRIVLAAPPPSRRLAGRVVDGQGLPVAKAKVHLKAPSGSDPFLVLLTQEPWWHPCPPRPRSDEAVPVYDRASPPREAVALSGPDGRFAFDLVGAAEEMDVQAEAPGYLRQESTQVPAPLRFPEKIELVLERGAVVSGRVLTARGLPAAGAEVRIFGGRSAEAEPVRTDAAGRYRVPGIEPGARDIEVRHASGEERRGIEVVAGPSRQPDLILDDDPLREIRGRVTGPDGAGLATAGVEANLVPAPAWEDGAFSGEDGAFRLELRESAAAGKTLLLHIYKPGLTQRRLQLDPAAAFASPLAIQLDRGTRIIGHIVGVEADQLPEVTVETLQGNDRNGSWVSRDGEFEVDGLAPGELIAKACHEDRCGSARLTLEPGAEEVVLDLEIPAGPEAEERDPGAGQEP